MRHLNILNSFGQENTATCLESMACHLPSVEQYFTVQLNSQTTDSCSIMYQKITQKCNVMFVGAHCMSLFFNCELENSSNSTN